MSRRVKTFWVAVLSAVLGVSGCYPSQPFYFFEDGDLSHYKGVATDIEYPDTETQRLAEVDGSLAPFSLANADVKEIWDLRLQEAIQCALANSKVMRSIGGTVVPPPTTLVNAPSAIQTVYAPAVVESDPRFGVEGALSAFDTQFTSSLFWERNDRPVNLSFGNIIAPIQEQDLGTWQAALTKRSATGGQFIVRNNTTYEWNNNNENRPAGQRSNRFDSVWNNDIEAEFRHPLLQGAGAEFNRIAGPSGVVGLYNGVTIARINTDIALADFEAGVRNLVSDTELAYWELYFAYRNKEAVIAGRDSALTTWRKVFALYKTGAIGGEAEKEAQAREQYYLFRVQVENALSNLYDVESRLRYMMGLAPTDGRLIRPADEPTIARVQFDWNEVLPEAMSRSIELRRQKWQIKQRELQLIAAKNFLLPRLDAVGRYRWRGFGDDYIGDRAFDGSIPPTVVPDPNAGSGAWNTLFDGNYQEWQLGLQMSLPLGFRQPLAAVRNAQLLLARDRALLQDQELEVDHALQRALRSVAQYYQTTRSNFNRRHAAAEQVKAVEVAYTTGTVSLDLLLDAQRRLADAESQFYRSAVDYNLAIREVHSRKGSLLEYNGVYLAEGPWPGKAYFDARRRARERDAALPINYGFSRPNVFSRGPIDQKLGTAEEWSESEGVIQDAPLERVPTPAPEAGAGPSASWTPYSPREIGLTGQGDRLEAPPMDVRGRQPVMTADWGTPAGGTIGPYPSTARTVNYDRPLPPQAFQPVSPASAPHEPVANYPPAGSDRPAAVRPGAQY